MMCLPSGGPVDVIDLSRLLAGDEVACVHHSRPAPVDVGDAQDKVAGAPAICLPSRLRSGRQPGIFRFTTRLPLASIARIACWNPMPPCTVATNQLPSADQHKLYR